MELFETLKQLKKIQPNPTWTENSRRTVLMSSPIERLSFREITARVFGAAGSLVLTGALIFLIAGGFSGSGYLAPVRLSVIDPIALHAEAQAIDMQINLLNLSYAENGNSEASTPAIATTKPKRVKTTMLITANTTTTASSTATSTFSIDDALKALTQ